MPRNYIRAKPSPSYTLEYVLNSQFNIERKILQIWKWKNGMVYFQFYLMELKAIKYLKLVLGSVKVPVLFIESENQIFFCFNYKIPNKLSLWQIWMNESSF